MSTVLAHAVANNDRTVTARYFGTGNAVRTIWNLAGMDTDRAKLMPVLYKSGWGGIELLYSTLRTNVLYPSDTQFTGGIWNHTRTTGTTGITDPSGGTKAVRVVEDGTAGASHITFASPTLTAEVYTFSIYAKAGTRTKIELGDSGAGAGKTFNLSDGTMSVGLLVPGAPIAAGMISLPGGWYRCYITYTGSAAVTTVRCMLNNGSAVNYDGDGASYVDLFGVQIVKESTLSSYIRTTSGPVGVTDYSAAATGVVTHSPAVPLGTAVAYKDPHPPSSNVYKHYGMGDGASTLFSLPFAQVTPSIYIDGVLQTLTTHYTVTPAGVVTFVTPPGNGTVLTWTGNFGPQR